MMKKVIITGANGFLGSNLSRHLQSAGFETIAWLRNPDEAEAGSEVVRFDLREPEKTKFPEDAFCLIHCAWMVYDRTRPVDKWNLKAVEYLSKECSERGILFVFISSFSAHLQAKSHYGKVKSEAEQIINIFNSLIVKPALILGEGGLFNRIKDIASKSLILPLPGKGLQLIQTVWIDDLCRVIINLIEKDEKGIVAVAHEKTISIRELYNLITVDSSRKLFILPVPYVIMLAAAGMADFLGIRLPVSKESLLGVFADSVCDTKEISDRYQLLSASETLSILKKRDAAGSG